MSPDDRRAQIIQAAREVFIEYGLVGTRVRDIAAWAGITDNLVYLRFDSKQEIYQAAVTDPLERLVEDLVAEASSLQELGGSTQAKLERLHRVLMGSMLELAPLLAVALFSVPAIGREYYENEVLPRFSNAITAVIADVTGWDIDDLELEVIVEGLLGLHFGLALNSIFARSPVDVEGGAHRLAVIFGSGMVAQRKRGGSRRPRRRAESGGASEDTAGDLPPANPSKRMTAADRRADIARAAREVFLEHGFAGARTKDVADRAGITQPFMYRLFDGKEDLYKAGVEDRCIELLSELERSLTELAETGSSGAEALGEINERGIRIFAELGPLLVLALFSEMHRGREFYAEVLVPALRRSLQVLDGVEGWATPGATPGEMWLAIVALQFGTSVHHFLLERPIDAVELARQLTRMIVVGTRRSAVRR
jgi:AcrR family transcriptional regulator